MRTSKPNLPTSTFTKPSQKPIPSSLITCAIWKKTKKEMSILCYSEWTYFQNQPPTRHHPRQNLPSQSHGYQNHRTKFLLTLKRCTLNHYQAQWRYESPLSKKVWSALRVNYKKSGRSLWFGWGVKDRELPFRHDIFPQRKEIRSWGSPHVNGQISLCNDSPLIDRKTKTMSPTFKSASRHSNPWQ